MSSRWTQDCLALVSRRAFIPAALWVAVHLLVLPWIRNIVAGGDDELERQLDEEGLDSVSNLDGSPSKTGGFPTVSTQV